MYGSGFSFLLLAITIIFGNVMCWYLTPPNRPKNVNTVFCGLLLLVLTSFTLNLLCILHLLWSAKLISFFPIFNFLKLTNVQFWKPKAIPHPFPTCN